MYCIIGTYNIQSMGESKKYSAHIPEFLSNRPKFFLEHCMKRIPPKCQYLPITAITSLPNGEFCVPRSNGENFYLLDLERRMPSCSCLDWSKYHLPCKHMLSIFFHFPGHSWEFLHPDYTEKVKFTGCRGPFMFNNQYTSDLYINFFNSNVCAFCLNTSKNKIKPMKSFVTNQKIYICVCVYMYI